MGKTLAAVSLSSVSASWALAGVEKIPLSARQLQKAREMPIRFKHECSILMFSFPPFQRYGPWSMRPLTIFFLLLEKLGRSTRPGTRSGLPTAESANNIPDFRPDTLAISARGYKHAGDRVTGKTNSTHRRPSGPAESLPSDGLLGSYSGTGVPLWEDSVARVTLPRAGRGRIERQTAAVVACEEHMSCGPV